MLRSLSPLQLVPKVQDQSYHNSLPLSFTFLSAPVPPIHRQVMFMPVLGGRAN